MFRTFTDHKWFCSRGWPSPHIPKMHSDFYNEQSRATLLYPALVIGRHEVDSNLSAAATDTEISHDCSTPSLKCSKFSEVTFSLQRARIKRIQSLVEDAYEQGTTLELVLRKCALSYLGRKRHYSSFTSQNIVWQLLGKGFFVSITYYGMCSCHSILV